jgi:hypothetical protein
VTGVGNQRGGEALVPPELAPGLGDGGGGAIRRGGSLVTLHR